jgi:hypothetical protein
MRSADEIRAALALLEWAIPFISLGPARDTMAGTIDGLRYVLHEGKLADFLPRMVAWKAEADAAVAATDPLRN